MIAAGVFFAIPTPVAACEVGLAVRGRGRVVVLSPARVAVGSAFRSAGGRFAFRRRRALRGVVAPACSSQQPQGIDELVRVLTAQFRTVPEHIGNGTAPLMHVNILCNTVNTNPEGVALSRLSQVHRTDSRRAGCPMTPAVRLGGAVP